MIGPVAPNRPADPPHVDELEQWELGPSTVVGFFGRRRGGKTLMMAYFARQAYERGVRVFHNGIFNFGEELSLEALMMLGPELQNALLCIDEIHAYMDSQRGNSTVTYLISHALVQLGHRKVWLFYTTQDPSMVSRRLRFQTDLTVLCATKNQGETIRFRITHQGTIGPRGRRKAGTAHRMSRFWHIYDTYKIVDSMQAVTTTSDKIKGLAANAETQAAAELVQRLLAEGVTRCSASEFALMLEKNYNIAWTPTRVAKELGHLGVAPGRSNGRRFYRLDSFGQDFGEPEDEG